MDESKEHNNNVMMDVGKPAVKCITTHKTIYDISKKRKNTSFRDHFADPSSNNVRESIVLNPVVSQQMMVGFTST